MSTRIPKRQNVNRKDHISRECPPGATLEAGSSAPGETLTTLESPPHWPHAGVGVSFSERSVNYEM